MIHTVGFEYDVLPPPAITPGTRAQMRVNVTTTYRVLKTWVVFDGECGIPRQEQGPICSITPVSDGVITGTMYALVDMELAGGVTLFSKAFTFLAGVAFTSVDGTNPRQRWSPVRGATGPQVHVTGSGGASLPDMALAGPGAGAAPVSSGTEQAIVFSAGALNASVLIGDFVGTKSIALGATFFNAVKFTGNVTNDLSAAVYCHGYLADPTGYRPALYVGRLSNVLAGMVGGILLRGTGAVTLNTWYRVVVRYKDGVAEMRVNNVPVASLTQAVPIDIDTADKRVGIRAWMGGNGDTSGGATYTAYNALSDVGDALYWDRALQETELAGLDAAMALIYPSVL